MAPVEDDGFAVLDLCLAAGRPAPKVRQVEGYREVSLASSHFPMRVPVDDNFGDEGLRLKEQKAKLDWNSLSNSEQRKAVGMNAEDSSLEAQEMGINM